MSVESRVETNKRTLLMSYILITKVSIRIKILN